MRHAISTIALVVLFPLFVAQAKTIHVPGDWPTIQKGIEAALNNDTVLVARGVYKENIDFLGKAVTVKGEEGSGRTFIDGGQKTSVVTFKSGEDRDSVLSGFTLTNGSGTVVIAGGYTYIYGAGIFCDGASPVISDNHIYHNKMEDTGSAHGYLGGGIYCTNSARPLIKDNVFEKNQANLGGAIVCIAQAAPTIQGNTIIDNHAIDYHSPSGLLKTGGGAGIACFGMVSQPDEKLFIQDNRIGYNVAQRGAGAIKLHQRPKVFVQRNHIFYNSKRSIVCFVLHSAHISENRITDTLDGHAIYCWNAWPAIKIFNNRIARSRNGSGIWTEESSVQISGNVITENTNSYGAGLHLDGGGKVVNNIIAYNTATGQENGGGGIYLTYGDGSKIVNNTLVGNSSAVNGGAISAPKAHPTIVNSIVWNNPAPGGVEIYGDDCTVEYCNVMGGYIGTGNINVDPLFIDMAGGDLHLRYASPCRDAGDNNAPNLADEDFEGDPRMKDGIVDMGADEFFPHLYYTGEAIPNQRIDIKLIGPPKLEAMLLVGANLYDAPSLTVFGDWYLAPPITAFPLGPIPWSGVITRMLRVPPACPVPLTVPVQGVVRKQLTNLCAIEVETDYHPK